MDDKLIKLPKIKDAPEFENNFYFTCKTGVDDGRISKLLIQYELFLMSQKIPGDIVECGVFKGSSLIRFAIFRDLFKEKSKKIIGFDTFGKFPSTKHLMDFEKRKEFVTESGENSISVSQLMYILQQKNISKNIELVKGDVTTTVPEYVNKRPKMKISLLNLDVDLYLPTKVVLDSFYSKISKGGILILDNFNPSGSGYTFPGEIKAVKEFIKNKKIDIKRFDYRTTPCYIIKK